MYTRFNRSLLENYAKISFNKYVRELNTFAILPVDTCMIDNLIDVVMSGSYINSSFLHTYDIIKISDNIELFLKRSMLSYVKISSNNIYILRSVFELILSNLSPKLYKMYETMITYKKSYDHYIEKLNDRILIRNNCLKLIRAHELIDSIVVDEPNKNTIDNILENINDIVMKLTEELLL